MSRYGAIRLAYAARWIVAFALVAGTHAAAVAIAMRGAEPALVDKSSGAFLIELAPIASTMPAPPDDLTPGLPNVDSAETPAVAPSTAEKEPQREIEAPPLPELAAAPPDLTLPNKVDQPPDTPKEEPRERQQERPTLAQDASAASIAAAPPRIEEAVVADRAAAPIAGVSEHDRKVLELWQGAMSAHLVRYARFPANVREHARDRVVRVRFRVDRRGNVLAVEVIGSSSSDLLDMAAEAMVRRASPMPVPPHQATADALDLVVPVRFKARR